MSSSLDGLIKLSDSIEELSNSKDTYVFFIDMCDSTSFKQECIHSETPDSIWIMRQYVFLTRCAKIIKLYGGEITKTIGDEVMATFSVATDPVEITKCALDIFSSFNNIKAYNKGKYIIHAKASIDFGESYNGNVIGNDVFDPIGTCVDRCARISKFAQKDEITISEVYYNLISERITTMGLSLVKKNEDLKGLGLTNFFILRK
jgi:class 3 adenylate cyclase